MSAIADPTEVIELAKAVLKGSMVHVRDHHWGSGCYVSANVCIYCGWWDNWRDKHEDRKDCPSHLA